MTMPIDGDSRVSEALSARMEAMLADPDIQEPVTLGFVRKRLRGALTRQGLKADRSSFGTEESLYAEVESLVEEFGEDAPASDFTAVKASEPLSAIIEAIVDGYDEDAVPTLGSVHATIVDGGLARLAGDGLVEADEYESLLAEIEALVERYGPDAPAEEFLRFE